MAKAVGWRVVAVMVAVGIAVTVASSALARALVDRPAPVGSVGPVRLETPASPTPSQPSPTTTVPTTTVPTTTVPTTTVPTPGPTAVPGLPPVHVGPGGPHHRGGQD